MRYAAEDGTIFETLEEYQIYEATPKLYGVRLYGGIAVALFLTKDEAKAYIQTLYRSHSYEILTMPLSTYDIKNSKFIKRANKLSPIWTMLLKQVKY